LSGQVPAAGRRSCAVISGGNVDPSLVDRILQFGLGAAGRHLRLRTRLEDRPGNLARLSALIADQGANILEVVHHRLGAAPSLTVVELELTLEVRDRAHRDAVLEAMRAASYVVELIR
jgi:threonine dehydratase